MLYHYKMKEPTLSGGLPEGDGSQANPWYWYSKTQNDNTTIAITISDRKFIRVKLIGGTPYTIQENFPGGDAYLYLYDGNGDYIT